MAERITGMGLERSYPWRVIVSLLTGIGMETIVVLVYISLPVKGHSFVGNDVVPANPEFLQWTHLPSWYIVVGIAQVAPDFFESHILVALLLLFGIQSALYIIIAYGLMVRFRK